MSGTVELEAELKPCPMSDEDKVRFRRSPCFICGYNGPGYYQRETHECAARYHATYEGLCATLRADNERLGRERDEREIEHRAQIADMSERFRAVNIERVIEQSGQDIFELVARVAAAEAERDTLLAQVEKLTGEIKKLRRGNGDE